MKAFALQPASRSRFFRSLLLNLLVHWAIKKKKFNSPDMKSQT